MKYINKVPGGTIIIPLLAAVLLNTIWPGFLNIGGPATALFKEGNSVIMGLFLIICGSQIKIKEAGTSLYKGTVLVGLKFIIGVLIGYLVNMIWGPAGILTLTPFALIAGLTNSNSSLYVAMSSEYGDSSDTGAVALLSINDGPFLTMVAMGVTGLADIPWQTLVGTMIPLLIGVIWGNLDNEFGDLAVKAQPFIVIWMSFGIGANSNLQTILSAGLSGIWLSLISLAMGVIIMVVYNLFLKKRTAMGVLMGTIAANSALTPAIIAAADPSLSPYVDAATAQLATSSIITMIAIPIMLAFFDRKLKEKFPEDQLTSNDKVEQIEKFETIES